MSRLSGGRRFARLMVLAGLTIALVACASPGIDTATVTNGTVEISARGADFNVARIEAKEGEGFTVRFTNRDPIGHDFAVYSSEGGDLIVRGELITGPDATTEILVPALGVGTYFFRCDPHADHMKGTLVVGD